MVKSSIIIVMSVTGSQLMAVIVMVGQIIKGFLSHQSRSCGGHRLRMALPTKPQIKIKQPHGAAEKKPPGRQRQRDPAPGLWHLLPFLVAFKFSSLW